MKLNKFFYISLLLVCLNLGCYQDASDDIRPPLIDRSEFTTLVPVLVTNEFNMEEYDFRLFKIQKNEF
jgi:hypothetical protein